MIRRAAVATFVVTLGILGLLVANVRASSPSNLVFLPSVPNLSPPFAFDDFSDPTSGWPIGPVTDKAGATIATRGYVGGTYQVLFQQGGYLIRSGHNYLVGDFQAEEDVYPQASTGGTIGFYFDYRDK